MNSTKIFSSFSCEIKIQQTKGIEFSSSKNLFVRYYLSAGNHKRICLNTREVSSKSDFLWNESFSLDCLGTEDSIHSLKQSSVIFELRKPKTVSILGRIGGSQVIGRVEIPWKQVFESPSMVIDKWVSLVSDNGNLKQIKLKIEMKVKMEMELEKEKKRCRKWNHDECGCGCKSKRDHCRDYDLFAIAAAMEFL